MKRTLISLVSLATLALPVMAQIQVTGTYTLPNVPLSQIQPAIQNDRKLLLGGVGSDLWHGPKDAANQFWMITDRGPNGEIKVDDKKRRTFPTPEFTPLILQVQVEGDQLKILKTIPILGQSGAAVTGLSNLKGYDEKPYMFDAQQELNYNPNGLDSEGLVQTTQGDFWVADEYSPSLVHIAADGKVIKRYIPEGLELSGADYPVAATLPAIFTMRKGNRGFEGVTISPDETTLYIVLQSPLSNPDKKIGDASRVTRILAFDIASANVTAEYAYVFDVFSEFDPKAKDAAEMKLSGLAMISPTTMLALERTDLVAKLYAVDLSKATNLLGTKWDDKATSPSLEATTDLAAQGVVALPKTLIVDLSTIPGVPGKIEGVTILDDKTVAIANDNDFDIGDFDANGNNQGRGATCKILTISLSAPLQ